MKEEAKMVYLLECLQKTPPPVSSALLLLRQHGWGQHGHTAAPGHRWSWQWGCDRDAAGLCHGWGRCVGEPCSTYEQVLGPELLCFLLSKREWVSRGVMLIPAVPARRKVALP